VAHRCRCARQPEDRGAKQSGRTGWSDSDDGTAVAAVQAEHRLNLERQIGKMATRIDRRFLATSNPQVEPIDGSVTHGQCNARPTVTFTDSISAVWPVPTYTAWWQRHMCVNNLPGLLHELNP